MENDLQIALQHARSAVLSDPGFDLPLGHRKNIWSMLGAKSSSDGLQRRIQLAASSIKKVMPIWDLHFGTDTTAKMLLTTAEAVASGRYLNESAIKVHHAGWAHMDELAIKHRPLQSVICVGYAAAQLVITAIDDEDFDIENKLSITDRDVDPDEFDCAGLCAAAQACGFVWNKSSNKDGRLAFWLWWVDEAVPAVSH